MGARVAAGGAVQYQLAWSCEDGFEDRRWSGASRAALGGVPPRALRQRTGQLQPPACMLSRCHAAAAAVPRPRPCLPPFPPHTHTHTHTNHAGTASSCTAPACPRARWTGVPPWTWGPRCTTTHPCWCRAAWPAGWTAPSPAAPRSGCPHARRRVRGDVAAGPSRRLLQRAPWLQPERRQPCCKAPSHSSLLVLPAAPAGMGGGRADDGLQLDILVEVRCEGSRGGGGRPAGSQ